MATQKFLTDIISNGSVESTEFKKTGGSASQFLKADGSVDSNVYLTAETDSQTLSISGSDISISNGNTITLPDGTTDTQLSNEEVQDIVGGMVSSNTETNISVSYNDSTGKLDFVSTDTNTQLSDSDIAAMGYIKTDTNTQLSDGDIAAFGYIKTDTNTQLSDSDIAAFGYIKTDTNTQLSESEITAMGFIQTQSDSQTLSISSNTISISGGNSIDVYDQTLNKADNVEFNDITADKLFLDPTQVGGPAIGSVFTSWDTISGDGASPATSKFDKVTVAATSANSTSNVSSQITITEGNGSVEHGWLYGTQPLVRTTGSADYQGQNALYAAASHRGSGDAASIIAGVTSIAEINATGTGTINYLRGIDILSDAAGSADVNYLQGMHLSVDVGNATVKEDLSIAYLDFDYSGSGKVEGDFAYLRAGVDTNSMVVDGDSRFIHQENTLPSKFGGLIQAEELISDTGIKMGNDTATASASNVGTMRYRETGTHSYTDMCMKTGASTYEWTNIVEIQF